MDIRERTNIEFEQGYERLAHPYRLHIIDYLDIQGRNTVPISEMTDYLVELDVAADSESARIRLLNTHLPILAEGGFLEFDGKSGTICYSEPNELAELLDFLRMATSP